MIRPAGRIVAGLALLLPAVLPAGLESGSAVAGRAPRGPDDSPLESPLVRGLSAFRQGRFADARALLASSPGPEAAAWLVRCLLEEDRWSEALERSRGAVEAYPDHPEPRAAYLEALFRAGRLAEAAAVRLPGHEAGMAARGWVIVGRLRAAEGRHGEARSILDRALARSPQDPWVVYWTAGAGASRAEIVRRLEHYLALEGYKDPDRVRAAEGKIRLFRALGERAVWRPAKAPERLSLPLEPLPDRRGGAAAMLLEARLGDLSRKPVRLLWDTGSPGLYLLYRIARKRGFVPLAEETAFGGGGGGRHASPSGLLARVAFGELIFGDALVSTTRKEIHPTGRYVGVVGPSVFDGYIIRVRWSRRRLELTRARGSSPEAEGSPSPDGGAVRCWNVSGQWLIEAEVPGRGRGLFLLDTGATRTAVAPRLAPEGVARAEGSVWGFGGQRRGVGWWRTGSVRLLGTEGPRDGVWVVDLGLRSRVSGVEISGFVGLDVLGRFDWVLDTVRHEIRRTLDDEEDRREHSPRVRRSARVVETPP